MTHRAAAFTPVTVDTLALVGAQLREAADRLSAVAGRAATLPDDTNWQTTAATRFHVSARTWRDEVAALTRLADAAEGDVARVRGRVLFDRGAPL